MQAAAGLEVEEALFMWICYQTNYGRQIGGLLTVCHVQKLQPEVKKHCLEEQRLYLKFSSGWASRFKIWYGLSSRTVHGNSLSADEAAIAAVRLGYDTSS